MRDKEGDTGERGMGREGERGRGEREGDGGRQGERDLNLQLIQVEREELEERFVVHCKYNITNC